MRMKALAALIVGAGLTMGLSNMAWAARLSNRWYFSPEGTTNITGNGDINPDTSCISIAKACSAASFTPGVVKAITQLQGGENAQFDLVAPGTYGYGQGRPVVLSGSQSIVGQPPIQLKARPTFLGMIELTGSNQVKNLKIVNDKQVEESLPYINPVGFPSVFAGIYYDPSGSGSPIGSVSKVTNVDIGTASREQTSAAVDVAAAGGVLSLINDRLVSLSPGGAVGTIPVGIRSIGDAKISMTGGRIIIHTSNKDGTGSLLSTGGSGSISSGSITTQNVTMAGVNANIEAFGGKMSLSGGEIRMLSQPDLEGQYVNGQLVSLYPNSDVSWNNVNAQISRLGSAASPVLLGPIIGVELFEGSTFKMTGGILNVNANAGREGGGVAAIAFVNAGANIDSGNSVVVNGGAINVAGSVGKRQSTITARLTGQFSPNTACTVNHQIVNCATSTQKLSEQELQSIQAQRKKRQKVS